MELKWDYTNQSPAEEEPGWYATLYCWDSEEGSFNGLNYWYGTEWDERLPVIAFAGPFEDQFDAADWMERNDNSF